MAAKSGIKINPANKGKLHKTAKVAQDKKIPVAKLQQLKKSPDPATRKRANFALASRKWKKK